ncbi:MAG TPA: dephospho-CoA kinase [Candidatus Borkfalkia avistercoris]|uniref:Dephospho-CoA kinase n=1 Tax=Candidatus Borkfalkia avistercoris TaxID=2838504 RepID=A0A9D2CZE2_9FIRM|nr:dephospho-CoA kinase [Candidatus Borkfalkia avistercoris]
MKQNNGKIYTAVTGGIGSGKSTVMRFIAELGYPVLSADEAARNIYDEAEVLLQMRERFSDCFTDGAVDRNKVSSAVFKNRDRLNELNEITHPAIMKKIFSSAEREDGRFIFFEIPLLFEGGFEKLFDHVIVLMRDKKTRIAAVEARDGLSGAEVAARIKNQFNYEKNLSNGHTVIYNDGDIASLYNKVSEAVRKIVAEES